MPCLEPYTSICVSYNVASGQSEVAMIYEVYNSIECVILIASTSTATLSEVMKEVHRICKMGIYFVVCIFGSSAREGFSKIK